MTAKPTVTVCIPLYEHADTVERALSSALVQDFPDYEILVVDDASSDRGAEIASTMLRPGDRLVVNETRLGAAQNHNRCIALARGDLIQFIHGDDELLPDALSTLAPAFDDNSVAMAFAPRRVVTDDEAFRERWGVLHHRFRGLKSRNDANTLLAQYAFAGIASWNWFGEPTSVMFRRSDAVRVGGFNDALIQTFDLDLWLHVSAGRRIAFVDRELSVRHHHAQTLSVSNLGMRKHWLDDARLMWGVVCDPCLGGRPRVYTALWLVNVYATAAVNAFRAPRGSRGRRLRDVASVPWHMLQRRRATRAYSRTHGDPD